MKSIRRTTILALSMFIILALLSFGSAFAYFSDKANAGGSVTLGHLEIELKQGSDTVTALATVNNLEPGGYLVGTESNYHSYTIDTTKANIACYLRVKISSELEDVPSNDIFNTDLGTGWYLHNDGYYYQVTDNPATSSSTIYKVPASQNSVQLNVKIQLKPSVEGKEYMNKSGSYKIIVQALQADYLESISEDNTYTVTELSNIWSQSLTTEEIFIIEDGVLTGLTDYGKTLSRLTVPSGVTAIGDRAFQNNTNLVSVTLPDEIQSIGTRGFEKCYNLNYINMPEQLETFGQGAFNYCESLEIDLVIPEKVKTLPEGVFQYCYKIKSLTLNSGLENIKGWAFNWCKSISNDIVIPEAVTSIGQASFQRCSKIKRLELNDNIVEIGEYAFNFCENLEVDLVIPSSVTNIGRAAFQACYKLKSLTLNEGLTSIGVGVFNDCHNLQGELTIPSTLTNIEEGAFADCYNITDIIVRDGNSNYYSSKDGVNYHAIISNDGTFIRGCNLSSIPNNIKIISYGAFEGCEELTTITLPNTLTKIGNYAFNGCSNLEIDLVIPNSVTSIGKTAFQACYKLKSLTLNEGLLWIGNFAFNNCYGITNTSITIPSTVVQIGGESYIGDNEENEIWGSRLFSNCATNSLTKFEVASGNTHFKTDEYGVLYTKNNKYLVAYPSASEMTEYSILEGCERLFELSMSRLYNLNILYIPDSLILEYTNTITPPSTFLNQTMNPLQGGISIYTAINDFVVNDSNPNYKSVDGIIYSKDGTRVIAVPVGNWKKNGANKVLSFDDSVTSIENIFYHWERDIDLDKIIIGANISSIHEYFITNLNEMVDNYGLIIEIDSNNEYYELVNGKIVPKNTSIQVSGAPNGSENNKPQPSDAPQVNNDYHLNFDGIDFE